MNLISLWNLHNDIFDDIKLPPEIDKDIAVNYIFQYCGTYGVLDHDYPLCRSMITLFFARHYDQYKRLIENINLEYILTQNYDRNREYTRINAENRTGNEKRTGANVDTNKVSAYNSTTYADDSQTSQSIDENTENINATDTNETIREHEYGDLSVQNMSGKVKEEIELRKNPQYNIYQIIASDFFDEMMLRLEV